MHLCQGWAAEMVLWHAIRSKWPGEQWTERQRGFRGFAQNEEEEKKESRRSGRGRGRGGILAGVGHEGSFGKWAVGALADPGSEQKQAEPRTGTAMSQLTRQIVDQRPIRSPGTARRLLTARPAR